MVLMYIEYYIELKSIFHDDRVTAKGFMGGAVYRLKSKKWEYY